MTTRSRNPSFVSASRILSAVSSSAGKENGNSDQARTASSSHGVVTRRQLLGAGLSGAEIKRRVRKGLLIRQYKGVYRVGHQAPSLEARYLAAVRACGDGAVLCGFAAGHLHGLLKGSPPPPQVMALVRRNQIFGGLSTVSFLAIIFLMIIQPGGLVLR